MPAPVSTTTRVEVGLKLACKTLVALAVSFAALPLANPVSASSRPNISSVAVLSSSHTLGIRLPPGVSFTAAQDLFTTNGAVYVIVIGGDFTTHGWEGRKMMGTGPEPLASHFAGRVTTKRCDRCVLRTQQGAGQPSHACGQWAEGRWKVPEVATNEGAEGVRHFEAGVVVGSVPVPSNA